MSLEAVLVAAPRLQNIASGPPPLFELRTERLRTGEGRL